MCVPVDGGGPGVDGADAAVAAGAVGPDDEGGVVVGVAIVTIPGRPAVTPTSNERTCKDRGSSKSIRGPHTG